MAQHTESVFVIPAKSSTMFLVRWPSWIALLQVVSQGATLPLLGDMLSSGIRGLPRGLLYLIGKWASREIVEDDKRGLVGPVLKVVFIGPAYIALARTQSQGDMA